MTVHVNLSLDCHTIFTPKGTEHGVRGSLELINEIVAPKHTTWFLSESYLCEDLSFIVDMILDSGAEIGLHKHFTGNPIAPLLSRQQMRKEIETAVHTLEKYSGKKIEAFRSGWLMSSPELFDVLMDMDIKYDSTMPADMGIYQVFKKVVFKRFGALRQGIPHLFLKRGLAPCPREVLPFGCQPFIVNRSSDKQGEGKIIEFPIHVQFTGRRNNFKSARKQFTRALKSTNQKRPIIFIYWHPFDLTYQKGRTVGRINERLYEEHRSFHKWLTDNYSPTFESISEIDRKYLHIFA